MNRIFTANIAWLLDGDPAIQFQVHRDLLDSERPDLQKRIATEGWGAQFLAKRRTDGHWGRKFYQPKWTSSHYTLLDLRNLCISPAHPAIQASIDMICDTEKADDGGILPISAIRVSDVCVNGMFLNYATYFQTKEEKLKSVVDCLLSQRMPDGGFNCRSNRSGAVHSSLHSTLSVLEGIAGYRKNGYRYRLSELEEAEKSGAEFILLHRLFLSDRTGEIIHRDFLRLSYPGRWRYDILRALDYFQYAGLAYDERMAQALEVLLKKRNKDGTWNVQAHHPGQLHFAMEQAGKPSRWNTLRALRVLRHYKLSPF
jgi:hypothetical protein